MTGPNGPASLDQRPRLRALQYSKTTGNVTTGLPGGTPLFLGKGSYTVTGSGGAGVGAFSAAIALFPILSFGPTKPRPPRLLAAWVNWLRGPAATPRVTY